MEKVSELNQALSNLGARSTQTKELGTKNVQLLTVTAE